jgi:aldose sugar dehydrogenase
VKFSAILFLIILVSSFLFWHNFPRVRATQTTSEMKPVVNDHNLRIEVVADGLKVPTSMAFLGSDDILFLEKDSGKVRRIINGTILDQPLLDVAVESKDERGMLGIAVSLNETDKRTYVFLYYTLSSTAEPGHALGNRLYRYELLDNHLVKPKLLIDIPAVVQPKLPFHDGGKIVIGSDNNVYLTVGDLNIADFKQHQSKAENYQNGAEPDGSSGILRVTQEGEPTHETILGDTYPLNLYYAYGIRNSFGIDFDPITGYLWDTENGPDYGDEINLVEPALNSGAGSVYGIAPEDFDPDKLVYFNGNGHYSDPEFEWDETVAPTALKFFDSNNLGKEYENDMFVGDVKNGYIYHFELDKNRKTISLYGPLKDKIANNNDELHDVVFARGFGGVIDIQVGPDGYMYLITIKKFDIDYEGTIYRILPKSSFHYNYTQILSK